MKKVKFIAKDIKFTDLSKNPINIPDIHQSIGNVLYLNLADIGWKRIAEDIYDGKEVELDAEQLNYLSKIIEQSMLIIFVKVGIMEYITDLIAETA